MAQAKKPEVSRPSFRPKNPGLDEIAFRSMELRAIAQFLYFRSQPSEVVKHQEQLHTRTKALRKALLAGLKDNPTGGRISKHIDTELVEDEYAVVSKAMDWYANNADCKQPRKKIEEWVLKTPVPYVFSINRESIEGSRPFFGRNRDAQELALSLSNRRDKSSIKLTAISDAKYMMTAKRLGISISKVKEALPSDDDEDNPPAMRSRKLGKEACVRSPECQLLASLFLDAISTPGHESLATRLLDTLTASGYRSIMTVYLVQLAEKIPSTLGEGRFDEAVAHHLCDQLTANRQHNSPIQFGEPYDSPNAE